MYESTFFYYRGKYFVCSCEQEAHPFFCLLWKQVTAENQTRHYQQPFTLAP